MKNTIIFSGSGGQGVMSMGSMLAEAAVESGKHAVYMPSYGPEQRGGSAKCVVIIDEGEIVSPMAEFGEVLVALNNVTYKKFIGELEPGGVLIYDSTLVPGPIERDDITAVPVPAGALAAQLGSARVANIVILGALLARTSFVSVEEFRKNLDQKFASKSDEVRALNRSALTLGLNHAQDMV